jgi:hypothetical protein
VNFGSGANSLPRVWRLRGNQGRSRPSLSRCSGVGATASSQPHAARDVSVDGRSSPTRPGGRSLNIRSAGSDNPATSGAPPRSPDRTRIRAGRRSRRRRDEVPLTGPRGARRFWPGRPALQVEVLLSRE